MDSPQDSHREARVAAIAQQQERGFWAGMGSFYVSPASAALLLLNLLDGLFTMTFLQLDVAEELNPLMRAAYAHSPLLFMLSKLVIVNAGLLLLCVHRSMRASRLAIRAGALVYHLAFLTHLVRHWPHLS
jgi:cytochrome bd-type quinol oxidase subunit 2